MSQGDVDFPVPMYCWILAWESEGLPIERS